VSFVAITLCVASQRVFIVVVVYFGMLSTQSGNFWIHLHITEKIVECTSALGEAP
jgi:hypothetical protein